MGKKHKKHKSEKHGYEDYGDRPLKLVLKVAGNEVTAGGSSLENTYDEQADYDKPIKDKKKKKKKREDKERSNPGSPLDDKRKRKMIKKRKGQDSLDTDWDEREQSRTPVRSDLASSLSKMEEKEQTPLQVALNQLIRQLQRKDPSAFFSFPVTDLIAPGYTSVIKRPMDFSTMKEKVKKEFYPSLEDLKVDFRIMCENAMIYNKPETIYHKAARKLLHSGMKILSPERLESLKQSIEFMADLDNPADKPGKTEEEGGSSLERSQNGAVPTDTSENSQSPCTPRLDKDSKDEASKVVNQAERELEEIRKVIEDSGGKLSNRGLQTQLEFKRRKIDGSTTLAILNPADLSAGDVGYCPVKLGMMSGRLQSGVNTLQGFREDKRNWVTPVCYMNYGPYTSYAPTYDSSFANISKDETDLIYSFYGEEPSLQGSESIKEFLAKSEEHVYKLADSLLDAMTNGEHSKTIKEVTIQGGEEREKTLEARLEMEAQVIKPSPAKQRSSSMSSLSSVIGLDLETAEDLTEEAQRFQTKLDENTKLLSDLQEAQNERLSAKQPPNMICLLAPTTKELTLAEKVTENLAQLTSQVGPGDVSSLYGVRRAMGIAGIQEPLVDLTTVETESKEVSSVGS